MLIKNFALSAARPVTPLLSYPYVGTSRAENSLVRAVNELVPRGVPGREDIVQSLLLALHENKITREQLRDRKTVGQAIRVFMRENFEGAGYAVSIDEPMKNGRSFHDVLSAEPNQDIA